MNNFDDLTAVLCAAVLGTANLGCAVLTDYNAVATGFDDGGTVVKETFYLADDEGNRILDDESNYITT